MVDNKRLVIARLLVFYVDFYFGKINASWQKLAAIFMTRTAILTILLFLLFIGCIGQSTQAIKSDSIPYYFPLEVFTDTAIYVGHDTFVVKWYSKHLHALNEPILFNDTSSHETYRFTWLRTFHNPVAIRIEKNKDSYTLFWKQSDGAGGYEPGKIVVDRQRTIDKNTWDSFLGKLKESDFWQLPTNKMDFGNDGSQWILEAKTPQKYHVVDRWTPGKGDKYYQVCDFLIKLADLKIKGNNKY
jgi:hypothetical protein